MAQFLPGATFVTLTVFMGYRIRRLAGAAACFTGFLLPPFALMVLLSDLYFFSPLTVVMLAINPLIQMPAMASFLRWSPRLAGAPRKG